MGLGLPLALLGLLALGIPLLLHRMRRRTLREQRLPTLVLLARAQAEDERPTRFQDLPLLLARLLVLALLVLAVAQPHFWTENPVVGDEPVALACVLDDSLSMLRDAGTDALFEDARQRVRSLLRSLPEGSEVALVLGGAPARVLHARDTDVGMAIDNLGAYEPKGARSTDLEAAVAMAQAQVDASKLHSRQLWLLSDCAQTSGADRLAKADPQLWVQCVGRDAREDNAYLEALALVPAPGDPGRMQLTVDVRSTVPEQVIPLQVRRGGDVIASGEVQLTDHVGRAIVDVEPDQVAQHAEVEVWLETHDALEADDHLPLSGPLATGPTVLLVDGAPSLQRADDELRLLSLALDAAPEDGRLNVVRTDFEGLENANIEGADVIVLANAPVPSAPVVDRLQRRVEAGAGLWVGVGNMADPFAYRGAMPQLLPAASRGSSDVSPALALQPAEPSEVTPHGALGLTRAGTSRRWLLETVPRGDGDVALRFEDGTAALVTGSLGEGRLALWTTSFDDDWSDVPLTPGFVAMVHSVIGWLSPRTRARTAAAFAGQPIPLRDESDATAFEVVLPTGERLEVAAKQGQAVLERTEHTGLYRVATRHSDGSRRTESMQFHVRVDPAESELRAQLPGQSPSAPAQAGSAGGQVRKGKQPVSRWVWLALGLAALAEALLRVLRPGRATKRPQAAG